MPLPRSSRASPSSGRRAQARYEDQVFVNCPFDDSYRPMLEAVVFAVHACGFYARSALEFSDSAENRLDKIMRIIADCRYGIHDISRTEVGEEALPRFNMPLELGIFLGCRKYGSPRDRRKVCLVLDRERYRYQRFISDIAGQDVDSHGSDSRQAVTAVRNWLAISSRRDRMPGGAAVWDQFGRFQTNLPEMCREARISIDEMTFTDRTHFVSQWLIAAAG